MKLNNKGFTIVEILITFILVSIVSISLFATISSFNERRIIESQRAKIYEYKNSLVNRVQSDFIERGLAYASITRTGGSNTSTGVTTTVRCLLKDGSERILNIHQRYTRTILRVDGNANYSDDFYIEYGPPDNLIREEIPDLGESLGYFDPSDYSFVEDIEATNCRDEKTGGLGPCSAKNLQINSVLAYITDENDINSSSHVLNIYIGFYGYDLGNKYSIIIVAPIDYQKSSGSPEARFPVGDGEFQIHSVR